MHLVTHPTKVAVSRGAIPALATIRRQPFERHSSTLTQHELRRIVAGMIG